MRRVSIKTLKTLFLFAALALVAGLVPGLSPWGPVDPVTRALGLAPAEPPTGADPATLAGGAPSDEADDSGDAELATAALRLEQQRARVLDDAPAAPAPSTEEAVVAAPAATEPSPPTPQPYGRALRAEPSEAVAPTPVAATASTEPAPAEGHDDGAEAASAPPAPAPTAPPTAPPVAPETDNVPGKAEPDVLLTTAGYEPPAVLDDPCIPYGSPTCPRRALDGFFKRLARSEAGEAGAITRVLHFGDSAIAGDDVTSTLRERFQTRFGDAGPGFVFIDKPWSWYGRAGVRMASREGWKPSSLIYDRITDGAYGLGGVAFQTVQKGVSSRVELTSPLSAGPAHVELFYLGQPLGGTLRVTVGEEAPREIDTVAPVPMSGFASFDSTGPIERVVVETTSGKPLRLFGVVVEHGDHGVVWDSLGIVGARAIHLGNYDATHLREQIARRDPGLVILHFGLNEAQGEGLPGKRFRVSFKAVLDMVRLSAPRASCMIIGPSVVARLQGGVAETRPIVPALSKAEREVARECGCAFFDTLGALGSKAPDLLGHKPRLLSGDYTHLTRAGAEALGEAVAKALLSAYEQRRPAPR
jgi:lysophospholipase L1-like esterase